MEDSKEGPAPWTIAQKIPLKMFPIMMVTGWGLLTAVLVAPGPPPADFKAPLVDAAASGSQPAVILFFGAAIFIVALLFALIPAARHSECPDERDSQIEFKALRRFFWFVQTGVLLPVAASTTLLPPEAVNRGLLACGLVALALAPYYGSVLQPYYSANRS